MLPESVRARLCIGITGLFAGALVGAAPAAAALSYPTNTVPMPANAYTDVDVSCPVGQSLLSGGVADSAAYGDAGVVRTIPIVDDTGWTASVGTSSTAPPGTVTAYAVCTSPPARGRLTYIDQGEQNPAMGDVASALATCSRGKVVGGGIDGTDLGVAYGSRPADGPDADHKPNDAWRGTMYNVVGGAVNFHAYATCATGDLSHHLDYVRAIGSAKGIHMTSVAAKCPKHTKVLGGGATASLTPGLGVLDATRPNDGPDADSKPDDGWIGAFDNELSSPVAMKTYAVCRG